MKSKRAAEIGTVNRIQGPAVGCDYDMPTDTQKLRVLRARTDHELLILVQRELERGLALVDVATSKSSPLFIQAERAFGTAKTLVARISGVDQDDRLRIEKKLNELRSRLDQIPSYANARPFPASFAS